MPLSPFTLPAPLPPGQAAYSLLTTASVAVPNDLADGALILSGPSSGEIDRWRSSPLGIEEGAGHLNFTVPATLPFSQTIVQSVYLACVIQSQAPGSIGGILGYKNVSSNDLGGGSTIVNQTVVNGQYAKLVATGGAAQTYNIPGVTFSFVNNSSVSSSLTPPGDKTILSAIGVIVFYTLAAVAIGHGCNANLYSPISFGNGIVTAPGNGIITVED